MQIVVYHTDGNEEFAWLIPALGIDMIKGGQKWSFSRLLLDLKRFQSYCRAQSAQC